MVGSRRENALSDSEQRTVDQIEREICTVLCDEPSPDFLARARQRIAGQAVPARRWLPWCAAAGVSAATLLLAIVVLSGRQPNVVGQPTGHRRAAIAPVSPRQASDAHAIGGATAAGQPVRLARAGTRRTSPKIRPEVLVPKGQLQAIHEFVERMRISPIDAQSLSIAADVPSAPNLAEIVVAPLLIEPEVRAAAPREPGGRDEDR